MKIIIYTLFTLVSLITVAQNEKDTTTYGRLVTPDFETFDFERFDKIKENETFGAEILSDSTNIYMQKRKNRLRYEETRPNSYFTLLKNYYPNGNIKSKGLTFNYRQFKKGIWYFFNEQGDLTDSIDYDKSYKYDFDQLLEFCKKEKIYFMKGEILDDGYAPSIWKEQDKETNKPLWRIRRLKEDGNNLEDIEIDAQSGAVISRSVQFRHWAQYPHLYRKYNKTEE